MTRIKNLTVLIVIVFLLQFVYKMTVDFNNTYVQGKFINFNYNFFNEPYKFIFFKFLIHEQEKEFAWKDSGNGSTIYLEETVYFNYSKFTTVLERRELYVK